MIPTNPEARAYAVLLVVLVLAVIALSFTAWREDRRRRYWRKRAIGLSIDVAVAKTMHRMDYPPPRVPRAPEPALHYDESVTRRYLNDETQPMRRVDGAT